MASSNAVPIGVIIGLIAAIFMLVLLLRWLKHKNNAKEARERDVEEAKMEASRAFDDGASDVFTPVGSPRDALFNLNGRGEVVDGGFVTHVYDRPKVEGERGDARRM